MTKTLEYCGVMSDSAGLEKNHRTALTRRSASSHKTWGFTKVGALLVNYI